MAAPHAATAGTPTAGTPAPASYIGLPYGIPEGWFASSCDTTPIPIRSVEPVSLCPHKAPVECFGVTKNNMWLVTGSEDGTIRRWDVPSTLSGKKKLAERARKGLFDTIENEGELLSYWTVPRVKEAKGSAANKPPAMRSLAVHRDGTWVMAGTSNGALTLHSLRRDEGTLQHSFAGHMDSISGLELLPGEVSVASASWDKSLILWDLHGGAQVARFVEHKSQVTSLDSFKAEGAGVTLASCDISGTVKIWSLRTPASVATYAPSADRWNMCVACSPDGVNVLVGKKSGVVEVWETRQQRKARTLTHPLLKSPVTALYATPKSRYVLAAYEDNLVLWDISKASATFMPVPTHRGHISQIYVDLEERFAITSSGTRGWGGSSDSSALLYNVNYAL